MEKPELALRFSDDFSCEYGPPDYFDMTHWAKWKGDAKTENGRGVLYSTEKLGELAVVGIGTRQLHFSPGLKGTNGLKLPSSGTCRKRAMPSSWVLPGRVRCNPGPG